MGMESAIVRGLFGAWVSASGSRRLNQVVTLGIDAVWISQPV
jgi:hypothetical protein